MTCDDCTSCGFDECCCPASLRIPPNVIDEAATLIRDARATQHGDFQRNASTTTALLHYLGVELDDAHVPLVLMALKLARHQSNPTNRDNIVDAIGYLGLYARLIGMDA